MERHSLVPKHSKLSESDTKKLLEKFNLASPMDLPRILKDDPAIANIDAKAGEVIKIERISQTAGTATYYRVVIDG